MNKDCINKIVDNKLCMGCGVCESVCIVNAIKMTLCSDRGFYVPIVDKQRCNNCGLCLDSCPGESVDFDALNMLRFHQVPTDYCYGNYIRCYVGYSTDNIVRMEGASGGCVTQLLLFAMEKGIIDGAMVTRPSLANPMLPEVIIASSKKELLTTQKSIYSPVPLGVGLKSIMQKPGKYAVVGLPCHIQGIWKAARRLKQIKERVVISFGLFCGRTFNFNGRDHFLKTNNLKVENVRRIDYRCGGWPGDMIVHIKGGQTINFPRLWVASAFGMLRYKAKSAFDSYFRLERCLTCIDQTNQLADISFGDPWGIESLENENIGKSLLVSRSKIGEELIQSANSSGCIDLKEVKFQEMGRHQRTAILKKMNLSARISVWGWFRQSVPNYKLSGFSENHNFKYYMDALIDILKLKVSGCKILWRTFPYLLLFEFILFHYPGSLYRKVLGCLRKGKI